MARLQPTQRTIRIARAQARRFGAIALNTRLRPRSSRPLLTAMVLGRCRLSRGITLPSASFRQGNKEVIQNLQSVAGNSRDRTVGYLSKKVLARHRCWLGNNKAAGGDPRRYVKRSAVPAAQRGFEPANSARFSKPLRKTRPGDQTIAGGHVTASFIQRVSAAADGGIGQAAKSAHRGVGNAGDSSLSGEFCCNEADSLTQRMKQRCKSLYSNGLYP